MTLTAVRQPVTFNLEGGAGGPRRVNGDYPCRDGNQANQTNAGLWGQLRVHRRAQPGLLPPG